MHSKIILPLDHFPWREATEIIEQTQGQVWGYKIRRSVLEEGLAVIPQIKPYGKVMLDFKLYDIPSAMTESLKMHLAAGADITTVHCTSGYDPQTEGISHRHLAGVTILTSMDQQGFDCHYKGRSIVDMVVQMARDAVSRYEYLVCSPGDLDDIGLLNIKKICPGIRPEWYKTKDDQHRIATPAAAVRNGADLLVIGRPILKADDIVEAVARTNAEIETVLVR